jgi:glucosamine-6-phosphate deaminase
MNVNVTPTALACGQAAGHAAAAQLRDAIARQGQARLIMASAASQLDLVATLAAEEVDWPRVTLFHLDEYLGLSADHPASFRRFLHERFLAHLPAPVAEFVEVRGDAPDAAAECARLAARLSEAPVDVACIGIGENGHIAFNDPPADFDTDAAYLIVNLDEACRRQQLGEGWFPTLDDVPRRALTMSPRAILAARAIVCCVPDARKAAAVRDTMEAPISPLVPASILRTHSDCRLFLDQAAASLLPEG